MVVRVRVGAALEPLQLSSSRTTTTLFGVNSRQDMDRPATCTATLLKRRVVIPALCIVLVFVTIFQIDGLASLSELASEKHWIDFNTSTNKSGTFVDGDNPATIPSTYPPFDTSLLELPSNNISTCVWTPGNHDSPTDNCIPQLRTLRHRLPPLPIHALFFGDSTMRFLFAQDSIATPVIQYCRTFGRLVQQTERCHIQALYELEAASSWIPPGPTEGPTFYGLENPGCSDCRECETRALVETSRCPFVSGGYFAMDFARDVVLQSTLYPTTQENILHFVNHHYPQKETNICIVSTGQHDVTVSLLTLDLFADNIRWYLERMRQVCATIIWVGNTAPAHEYTEWVQGREVMRRLDHAVLLGAGNPNQNLIDLFIDVFPASLDFSHMDNIHMSLEWYEALAQTLHDNLLL